MNRTKLMVPAILLSGLLSSTGLVMAQDAPKMAAADNTKVNKRDRKKSEATADQGKNNKSDLETARQIRRAIVADKSLSVYAHNVKVISQGGKVTLKGTVHTDAEKSSIGEKATTVAGADNVTNQLLVKGDAKK
jgi:hyperosmotically inducible protein